MARPTTSPRLKLATRPRFYRWALSHRLGLAGDDLAGVRQAEERIARYVDARHAICTSLGRMAIYDGLRALLPGGGEVILSPVTVPEVISVVLLAGARPVFCDVEPGTWNLDPAKAEALIGPHTRAIMTTHFYGNMNTAAEVRRLCDEYRLSMIEDAAQAIGARQHGKHAGTLGDFGIFSFSYPKTITSFLGGALVTDDDTLASTVRANIAQYGPVDARWLYRKVGECLIKDLATSRLLFPLSFRMIRHAYRNEIGWLKRQVEQELNPCLLTALPPEYRGRMSDFQARLLLEKWGEIDADIAHRIACAGIYQENLAGIAGLTLPPMTSDGSHTYLYYPIEVEDRHALQQFLIDRGRDVALQHTVNCADLEAYRDFASDCPNARRACHGTLMLPTYPGYPLDEVLENTRVIREFLT
jgi:perosamine synthetase